MSSQIMKSANVLKKLALFEKGTGASLPEAYKKFYKEWQLTEPAAVNLIPEAGRWKRNEVTGEVLPIQNIPIPLRYPKEYDTQLWGGEGVVQGFQKRDKDSRRVPHFWVPTLKRTVVYSEVLDTYISVVVTNRALQLIHSNYGFDHYLLKTSACDLKSLLPLKIKRNILQALDNGCPAYENNPEKQKQIYNTYMQYLNAYTQEEIEWYGYSFREACKKMEESVEAENKPVPLKQMYRLQLIEKLKAEQKENEVNIPQTSSWMQKINPFGKKHET